MKITKNAIIKKMLLSLMIVVMLGNFVMPTRVQAKTLGGVLAEPIFDFITWIADEVIEFLQEKIGQSGEIQGYDGKYDITYSLGNIFSNKIAMFDVNFVNPNDDYKFYQSADDGWIISKEDKGMGSHVIEGTATIDEKSMFKDVLGKVPASYIKEEEVYISYESGEVANTIDEINGWRK